MPGINQFLPWAADPAADVMTPAQYAAASFTARILGYSTGTALSVQLNTTWRNASLITHMIGDFVVKEVPALDMLDVGTPAGLDALRNNFKTAVQNVARGVDISGYLPLTGGTLSGPLTIGGAGVHLTLASTGAADSGLNLSRAAGRWNWITGRTGALDRWGVALGDAGPEVGGNAGSNFAIARFHDDGSWNDEPLTISRATGIVDFARTPTIKGALFPYVPLHGGAMAALAGFGDGSLHMSGAVNGIKYDPPTVQVYGPWGTNAIAFGWGGSAVGVRMRVDATDEGTIATQQWVAAQVGHPITGFLPLIGGALSGNLTINAALVVTGNAALHGATFFSNRTDFVIDAYSNGIGGELRTLKWSNDSNDTWDLSDGTRRIYVTDHSVAPVKVNELVLSPNGDLYIDGTLRPAKGFISTATCWVGQPSARADLGINGNLVVDGTILYHGGIGPYMAALADDEGCVDLVAALEEAFRQIAELKHV